MILTPRLRGEEILGAIDTARPQVARWRDWLATYDFGDAPDDPYVWLCCTLALQAVSRGNYGVGAVITDPEGQVVAEGQNQLLRPYIRTNHHAEMMVLDAFEDRFRDLARVDGFTLYTSLECCPMCTVRLINTGIRRVLYAAADPECGAIGCWDGLPPFWRRMSTRRQPPQRFDRPVCAPALLRAANDIFLLTESELSELVARR